MKLTPFDERRDLFFFLFYTPIILDTLFPIRDISIGLFSREKIFGKILCSSHLNFESSEINSPLLNFFKVLSMILLSKLKWFSYV